MKMFKRLKKRGGFFLMEAVIALSVVTVVSITALSLIFSSISAKASAVNRAKAQGFAENAWECFKASKGEEEFIDNLAFAEGVRLEKNTDNEYVHSVNGYTVTVTVTVDFSGRATLNVSIKDDAKNKEINSFEYKKYEKGGTR